MKKTAIRFLSMLMVLSLVLGLAVVPAAATEAEPAAENVTAVESAPAEKAEKIDFSFDAATVWAKEDVVIDDDDPVIITIEEELQNIKVLNAAGNPVPLTQAEIQQILGLYQQYLDHWAANADVLGVQTPFFLSYNDNGADGLGILGEMLVLAGVSVDTVRAGYMSYDDIVGMIQNFLYGDALGVAFYGDIIRAARDEVLAKVEASGAQTDVQKYLVINDWLAQNTTFDMPYIMNQNKGQGSQPMVAETPVKHENYDNVYNIIYADYEPQIKMTFEAQIKGGLEAEFKLQYYTGAIKDVIYQGAIANGASEEEATAQAEQYLVNYNDLIVADPVAFVDSQPAFQATVEVTDAEGNVITDENGNPVTMTVAQQLHAGWEQFWENAHETGIEVDPVNAPGVLMTVDQIVQQQMDVPMEDLGGMTPNQAIPIYAGQAAAGLTEGVINYWQGSQFGALGRGTAVCLGYTKAFTYLTQFLHPEVYGVNGAESDLTVAANWKSASELYYNENGALDINQNYVVDTVRISFNASVTMFGITQDNFNSDHFWNAVKVDGKWYYIDPCYTDVYGEVMMRDRVETNGFMNHMYFMFSHKTCEQMYDGYYTEIKTLYKNAATHTDYEDSWMSRIKSNTFSDGEYFYYIYDSTDLITMLQDYDNGDLEIEDMMKQYVKLVRHKITGTDAGNNGDSNYETLIEFNYEADSNSNPVTRVLNPATGSLVKNDLLTGLHNEYLTAQSIYSSLSITCALYQGKVYFNLANCIASYDIATGAVEMVKEYNTIHGKRDTTNPFGGMAFSVVGSADAADFTVYNRPIAGMTIKDDGNMYVDVATNFGFISGKDPHNSEDQSSFGYEFEESNYNSSYSNYMMEEDSIIGSLLSYSEEMNDNDEFMWSANFVDTISMAHLTGSEHVYAPETVAPTCGLHGFTENRCTTCGAIQAGTRAADVGSELDHHYIYFEEEFYTKNKDTGAWNTGFCYVCTVCNYAVTEPEMSSILEGIEGADQYYEQQKADYDAAVASAGHDYVATDAVWAEDCSSVTFSHLICGSICPERANLVDCLLADATIEITLETPHTAEATLTGSQGNCATGVELVYTAAGKVNGAKFSISTTVPKETNDHNFQNGICTFCGHAKVVRVFGDNRYQTAFDAADMMKEELGVEKFENIVVARGTEFADALTGVYLANAKNAPMLLVGNYNMPEVVTYITENLTEGGTVYILGGTAAVPAEFDTQLTEKSVEFKRLAGNNRYETNLLILAEANVANEDIIVCTGLDYADSLSASATNKPILLVNNRGLNDAQKAFLDGLEGSKLYIAGGTSAVSEAIEAEVAAYGEVQRITGANRYETSVNIAKTFFEAPKAMVLAYGHNFPDGLCGGALAYHMNAPLVLTRDVSATVAFAYAEAYLIGEGVVLGGEILISDDTVRNIFALEENEQIVVK